MRTAPPGAARTLKCSSTRSRAASPVGRCSASRTPSATVAGCGVVERSRRYRRRPQAARPHVSTTGTQRASIASATETPKPSCFEACTYTAALSNRSLELLVLDPAGEAHVVRRDRAQLLSWHHPRACRRARIRPPARASQPRRTRAAPCARGSCGRRCRRSARDGASHRRRRERQGHRGRRRSPGCGGIPVLRQISWREYSELVISMRARRIVKRLSHARGPPSWKP